MNFLQGSVNLFYEVCKNMYYVAPNLHSMVQPIPASSLKLLALNKWPESSASLTKAGNFVALHLDKFGDDFPVNKNNFLRCYKQIMERLDTPFAENIRTRSWRV